MISGLTSIEPETNVSLMRSRITLSAWRSLSPLIGELIRQTAIASMPSDFSSAMRSATSFEIDFTFHRAVIGDTLGDLQAMPPLDELARRFEE